MNTEKVTEKVKKPRKNNSTRKAIEDMKEKYGDVVTLMHTDRKERSMTIFKPDHNRQVFWLALAGLTEFQIANVFGISEATIGKWKVTRPDFVAALQAGRMEAVGRSAHSLFQVANGYSHEDVKLIPNKVKEYDPDTGRVIKDYTEVLRVPYTKHYPPNVTALIKFLAAKHPEVWGDKSEVVHGGEVRHSMNVDKLSKKKLKMLQEIARASKEGRAAATTEKKDKKAKRTKPKKVRK